MPSQSYGAFRNQVKRMDSLCHGITDRSHREVHYHAAIAAGVSAWDAYINGLMREFYIVVARPSDPSYSALHLIANGHAQTALKRFNTPNWENTRALCISLAGYDPANDWNWQARGLSAAYCREFLNDILKVRHSFAHGLTMPSLSWTITSTGTPRLTRNGLTEVKRFLTHMAKVTDEGLKRSIINTFGQSPPW